MNYQWYWKIIWINKDILFKGMMVTIELSLQVIFIGTILGIIFVFLRRINNPLIKYPFSFFLEVLRGLPILIVLVWLYYVLPIFGIIISGYMAALIGLSLSLATYVSEAIRSGIESIPHGQYESAIALGYSVFQTMKRIVLPQAFKRILPNLLSLYINQIKLTSIASVIAVNELLHTAHVLIGQNYRVLELYTAVAVMYLIIMFPLIFIAYRIEKKLNIKIKII